MKFWPNVTLCARTSWKKPSSLIRICLGTGLPLKLHGLPSRWAHSTSTFSIWAKSKIGHHCDGRNFSSQLSFLSSQKPKHFIYITWINNHCPPQKHQWGAAMIKHVTVATHLKVRRTEFWSKILSVPKIHFRLSCFSSCVILHRAYYTIKQPTYFNKKGKN